jgi:hypothetical protein
MQLITHIRAGTRIERALVLLNRIQVKYIEEFTSREGLSRAGLIELMKINNPCMDLLKSICSNLIEPFLCPPAISSFYRSIRKAVCPAISITPKILWGILRSYLRHDTSIDQVVLFNQFANILVYKSASIFSGSAFLN